MTTRGEGDSTITVMLDGTITAWNPVAERLYHYAAAEAIGNNIEIIVPTDRLEEHRVILSKALKEEPIDGFATVRMAKGERRIHVSLGLRPGRIFRLKYHRGINDHA